MFIKRKKPLAIAFLFCGGLVFSSCNMLETEYSTEETEVILTPSIEAESDAEEGMYSDFFKDPYKSIDEHSRHSSPDVEQGIKSLASYLQKGTKTDLDKARTIYIWLTQNIGYDAKGYNSASYGNGSAAAAVLKNRIAVCEGFSNLYLGLGKEMDL
jgi:transglutaminase-like putative cysteine protease